MDLKRYFDERINVINKSLDELLPSESTEPSKLHGAMRYSVFAGGKRLRPVLFMAACEVLGRDWKGLLPYACALEMIHTYSLIHDDLPCMDDDDLRRGRATCHKVYDEATALLAGDALLTHAFYILAKVSAEPSGILASLNLLGEASGSLGMVGGQVLDLESEGKLITPQLMQEIHSKKTGALFRAAIVAAGLLSEAADTELAALEKYAINLGVAFQIVDDVLDVIGDQDLLGKPVGSDEKNAKSTYPAMFGLEEAQRMAQNAIDQAKNALEIFGAKAQPLLEIADFILHRDH